MRRRWVSAIAVCAFVACKSRGTSSPPGGDGGASTRIDPYSAEAWIAKLDDPKQVERAVTELQNLCDPRAITPLGMSWLRHRAPARALVVIIELAAALTPEQADERACIDYDARHTDGRGRPEHWADAIPYLHAALDGVDAGDASSIDTAVRAARALGDAQVQGGDRILRDALERHGDVVHLREAAEAALARYPEAVR